MTEAPAAEASLVACDGDGASGNRVQLVYAFEEGTPDRTAEVTPQLAAIGTEVDAMVAASAAKTGGERRVRFVHDADCVPTVESVTVPDGSLASFEDMVTALDGAGLGDPSRKYLVFADSSVYCGVAQVFEDDRRVASNANNGGVAMFGRVDVAVLERGDRRPRVAPHVGGGAIVGAARRRRVSLYGWPRPIVC